MQFWNCRFSVHWTLCSCFRFLTNFQLLPNVKYFSIKYLTIWLTTALCIESSLTFSMLMDNKLILYVKPHLHAKGKIEMVKGCCSPFLSTGTVDLWNVLLAIKQDCRLLGRRKTSCHLDNLTLNVDHSQYIEMSSQWKNIAPSLNGYSLNQSLLLLHNQIAGCLLIEH